MIVAEHEADEIVSRTHVHIWMTGSKYKTAEQYKRQFRKVLPQFNDLGGNALWAWTTKHPATDTYVGYMLVRGEYPDQKLLTPMFRKGFTDSELGELVRLRIEVIKEKPRGWERSTEPPSASKSKEKKPRTDWEILDDMIKDLESRPHRTHLKQVSEGLINVPVWSRQEIQNVISKHLNDNKKKAAVHELQRWVATLMRRLEGHYDQLWETVWARFDTKSRE